MMQRRLCRGVSTAAKSRPTPTTEPPQRLLFHVRGFTPTTLLVITLFFFKGQGGAHVLGHCVGLGRTGPRCKLKAQRPGCPPAGAREMQPRGPHPRKAPVQNRNFRMGYTIPGRAFAVGELHPLEGRGALSAFPPGPGGKAAHRVPGSSISPAPAPHAHYWGAAICL